MKYKFYKTKIDGKRRCQTRIQTYNPRGFAPSHQAQSAYTISIGGKGYQKQRASMETRTTSITERGALSVAMGRAPPKQIQRQMSIWHLAQGAYSYPAQSASGGGGAANFFNKHCAKTVFLGSAMLDLFWDLFHLCLSVTILTIRTYKHLC